jgi:hypothetical protein
MQLFFDMDIFYHEEDTCTPVQNKTCKQKVALFAFMPGYIQRPLTEKYGASCAGACFCHFSYFHAF